MRIGSVAFGGVEFEVHCLRRVVVNRSSCWGCCDTGRHRIDIQACLPRGRFLVVLRHEMAHAIQSTYPECMSANEETQAEVIAAGMAQNEDVIGELWLAYSARSRELGRRRG